MANTIKETRTLMDMENYIARHGKKGKEMVSRLLSALGKDEQFLNAFNSPVGSELLSDLVEIMETRLDKIIDETAEEKDKAEFRVAKELATRWVGKINEYNRHLKQLKEG